MNRFTRDEIPTAFASDDQVTARIQWAVQQAVQRHSALNQPVVVWDNGSVRLLKIEPSESREHQGGDNQ